MKIENNKKFALSFSNIIEIGINSIQPIEQQQQQKNN